MRTLRMMVALLAMYAAGVAEANLDLGTGRELGLAGFAMLVALALVAPIVDEADKWASIRRPRPGEKTYRKRK